MMVKICGITRTEDAALAASMGASAVGFVFWPGSPRHIEPERARTIVRQLPPFVTPVGVFVDQALDEVEEIAALVRLGAVQLHGNESPEYARALTHRVIKAVGLGPGGPSQPLEPWAGTTLLVDAHDPMRRGGTGTTADWAAAAALAREHDVVLAGGLHAGNVAQAVAAVRPCGIDVSSGVEAAPGLKDEGRMRALFAALAHMEDAWRSSR